MLFKLPYKTIFLYWIFLTQTEILPTLPTFWTKHGVYSVNVTLLFVWLFCVLIVYKGGQICNSDGLNANCSLRDISWISIIIYNRTWSMQCPNGKTVSWQCDLVNSKESIPCVCDTPYHKNNIQYRKGRSLEEACIACLGVLSVMRINPLSPLFVPTAEECLNTLYGQTCIDCNVSWMFIFCAQTVGQGVLMSSPVIKHQLQTYSNFLDFGSVGNS